ncbi:MAG: beta-Ala-His dipeptidase [Lachnospiraceae bacterium]|nr:beta-Ala-His dipeptidase [Lachnospiraceae bacterium]
MDFRFDAQEPVRVWYYFGQLSRIPRGSRNTAQVSDYCVSFAKEHGLKYRQDALGNVIIWKAASIGRESEPAVILQGHLDMVAEKCEGSAHDFFKDPLELKREGDMIYAQDTTLGGDDGIAIAYSMAILEDDTLSHPALVAVFTVDEEIGLLGAAALDMEDIDAKYVLNMDSETEGELIAGCAGGMTSTTTLELCTVSARQALGLCASHAEPENSASDMPAAILEISVTGLAGGHSGTEIQKEHCNAAKLFGRVLNDILREVNVCLIDAHFGQKDNAIPCFGSAHILAAAADIPAIQRTVAETERRAAKEHAVSDPHLAVRVCKAGDCSDKCGLPDSCAAEDNVGPGNQNKMPEKITAATPEDTRKVASYLMLAPNGILYWHPTIPGLVETSLNLGIFDVQNSVMTAGYSVRSSVASRKHLLGEMLRTLADTVGADYSEAGDYPGWEYREDSVLRPAMVQIYQELFGEKPEVCTIHAGLECGYFMGKKPDLDIVSFGPNIYDIHTAKERISISSVERGYRYVRKILETTL